MEKIYFGRGEDDPITLHPGGMSDRNHMLAFAFRPLVLCTTLGSTMSIMVSALRFGVEEQLIDPAPLGVLVSAPRLAMPDAIPGLLVYVRLHLAKHEREPVTGLLWLEGERIQ